MVVRQSNRVAAMENPTKEDLMSVLPEDFTDPPETEEQAAQEEDEAAQAEALQNQTAETDNPEKPAGEEPAENN